MPVLGSESESVTTLLDQWRRGDIDAHRRLIRLVYYDLQRMAAAYVQGENPQPLMQPSDLVQELYLRLSRNPPAARNRAEFFGFAARTMRRLLTEFARRRLTESRGGSFSHVSLEEAGMVPAQASSLNKEAHMLALDGAMERLEKEEPHLAAVANLRNFIGLTQQQAARELNVSVSTVKRDWDKARQMLGVWIRQELSAKDV